MILEIRAGRIARGEKYKIAVCSVVRTLRRRRKRNAMLPWQVTTSYTKLRGCGSADEAAECVRKFLLKDEKMSEESAIDPDRIRCLRNMEAEEKLMAIVDEVQKADGIAEMYKVIDLARFAGIGSKEATRLVFDLGEKSRLYMPVTGFLARRIK